MSVWILQSVPNWVFSMLGAASDLAFLTGPVALVMLAPHRWGGGLPQFHARLPAATLLSLLSVTLPRSLEQPPCSGTHAYRETGGRDRSGCRGSVAAAEHCSMVS